MKGREMAWARFHGRTSGWLGLAAIVWMSLATSCGSKGSVAVTAAIATPVVSVERPAGALVTKLGGQFTLQLTLGSMASSGTDISLSHGNFSLVRPADQATLVVLRLSAEPLPPYHLEPGAKLDVALTIADQPGVPGQLITDEAALICAEREAVQIAGTITDTASGQLMPVGSLRFAVTGCS